MPKIRHPLGTSHLPFGGATYAYDTSDLIPSTVSNAPRASKVSDDDSMLIIAVMATSELYLVDAETGAASLIDLGDGAVSGDGVVRAE